ncbi:hypothetical protein LK459_03910 [Gordonia otitidis]|uniref:hypothetical protein n=1 Tax=Gordonia otitidis TaxID=249058 RepID=UPI001D14E841|nr:hypothetical protein [Gordonia otitidis]UEA60037.1 hypothetical protein LK459_03910 [Gordonia otitidis]
MNPHDVVDNLDELLNEPLHFQPDPHDKGWLSAIAPNGRTAWLRMDYDFPDVNLWSLWLGHGRWYEMEDLPEKWSKGSGWPDDARPQLPKGEFYQTD